VTQTRVVTFFLSRKDALNAARDMIAKLTEMDFVETIVQNPDLCDVYAVTREGRGWYVKLTVFPEQVLLISFHPLSRPIRTVRGKQVKA
jgi:hypothetical protein